MTQPPAAEQPASEVAASEAPEAPPPPSKRAGALGFLKELPVLVVIAFALAILLKTFVVQAFYIPSGSMLPTLEVRDRVLVNKLVYRIRAPRRGEIIVFAQRRDEDRSFLDRVKSVFTEGFGGQTSAEKDFIKRVIALPGETIEVRDGTVLITPPGGEPFALDEPYVTAEVDAAPYGPETVPEGTYFVLGDNRPNSSDSRFIGPIARGDIIGKAFVRVWPLRRFGFFRRPPYGPT